MKLFFLLVLSTLILSSCVSNKNHLELQHQNSDLQKELTKTTAEKKYLETKLNAIQSRVDEFSAKINALSTPTPKKDSNTKSAVAANDAKKSSLEILIPIAKEKAINYVQEALLDNYKSLLVWLQKD